MRHPVDYAPSQDFGDNPTANLPASNWIIKQFGNYQPDGHTGTDYPCPLGTPVRAAADGKVLHVGFMSGTYADNPWWISPGFAGYVAVIDHGSFIGIYGHCLEGSAGVSAGDRVTEGQVFIRSGNTGASTGPHLHFECLPDGYVLNSYMYGRVNPNSLFSGSLSYAGTTTTITPLEDDDEMTPDQFNNLVAKLDELNAAHHGVTRTHLVNKTQDQQDVTRQFLSDRTKDSTLAILGGVQAEEAVTRAYVADTTQAQADVTRQYLSDRISETTPAELAELVPAEIAQQVIEALAAKLVK